MKYTQQMHAIVAGLLLTGAAGQTYGPAGCVSINKSEQGTCVIKTHCAEGVHLETLEFAFDCETAAAVQKHSFGVGGFDLVEEFDTGIKCSQCRAPANHKVHKAATKKSPVHLKKKSTKAVHMVAKQSASKGDDLVDKYGPGNCVEAFRGTTGTCRVKTQCKDQDISNYEFGMLCVHDTTSGENVRHLFGKNSFDPEEEFDTLIKCEQCLGLKGEAAEESQEGSDAAATAAVSGAKEEDLVKKVNTLVDEVGAMQSGLEKIKGDVKVLNEKVPKLFTGEAKKDDAKKDEAKEGEAKDEAKEGEAKDEAKEGEAKDDAKEGEAEGEAKEEKKPELFLAHHRAARHSHKKHHRKQRRSSDDDDEADEADKDDDEGSDDSSSSKQSSKDEDDEQDEDSSKDKDKDKDKDQDEDKDKDQDDSSNDKQEDDDGNHSEDAN